MKETLKKVKIKLALQEAGASKRLSEHLGCNATQLSLYLKTGYLPEKYQSKLEKWVKE